MNKRQWEWINRYWEYENETLNALNTGASRAWTNGDDELSKEIRREAFNQENVMRKIDWIIKNLKDLEGRSK